MCTVCLLKINIVTADICMLKIYIGIKKETGTKAETSNKKTKTKASA